MVQLTGPLLEDHSWFLCTRVRCPSIGWDITIMIRMIMIFIFLSKMDLISLMIKMMIPTDPLHMSLCLLLWSCIRTWIGHKWSSDGGIEGDSKDYDDLVFVFSQWLYWATILIIIIVTFLTCIHSWPRTCMRWPCKEPSHWWGCLVCRTEQEIIITIIFIALLRRKI